MPLTSEINEYVVGALLRYFRTGLRALVVKPRVVLERDLEMLRLHWAVSEPIGILANHILQNRHEIQTWLGEEYVWHDCNIRGRLLARETLTARALSGHPTVVVVAEPARHYVSGTNHLLIWTLQHALTLSQRFESIGPESSYGASAREVARLLERVQHIEAIYRARQDSRVRSRPSAVALAQAVASRRATYRLAAVAYRSLIEIERGDSDALGTLLRQTLIAPLTAWQSLELALGLAMSEALSRVTGLPLEIETILPGTGSAVFRCGHYRIFWQSRTEAYRAPPMGPFEEMAASALKGYGLEPGDDRPDVVVLSSATKKVEAVGEAKFFNDQETAWRDAVRGAVDQIIKYSRGYRPSDEVSGLLERSVIGVSSLPPGVTISAATGAPHLLPFGSFNSNALDEWAKSVIS